MQEETQKELDKMIERQKRGQIWIAILFVGVVIGFAVRSYFQEPSSQASKDRDIKQEELIESGANFRENTKIFGKVAEYVKPSVVNISTRIPDVNLWGIPTNRKSQGTGVIIDKNGLILTNYHVVKGTNPTIHVTTSSGDVHRGKRIGFDPLLDLALIKIEAKQLTPAKLGDSSQLKVGNWVIAVGSPFGLEQSVTTGIISALDRGKQRLPASNRGFIQTDASINPGNSGGPLVNLKGEVIGINTMIISKSGGSQGIGFAIPINTARKDIKRMKEGGRVNWGFLGASVANFSREGVSFVRRRYGVNVTTPGQLADKLGLEKPRGVLVTEIEKQLPPSPAQRAGLQPLDIILSYNGNKIETANELQSRVLNTEPGTAINLKVFRNGEQTITVKIGAR